jgi:hypothetical protein
VGGVGFWNGDTLIVHTNQIHGWKGGVSEFSDGLETVEQIRRVGDRLEGEITLYDPEVLVRPVRARMRWELDKETRPELRPTYNTRTDTNGPSTKVFMDDRGILNERLPGDPQYWDTTDPRPWRTYPNESDRRYEQYRKTQKRYYLVVGEPLDGAFESRRLMAAVGAYARPLTRRSRKAAAAIPRVDSRRRVLVVQARTALLAA